MTRHLYKGKREEGTTIYYFDAHKSKILDASDPADIPKISEIQAYGISPNEHSESERLGATGIPQNRILEISMDEEGNYVSICWVDVASAVAKGMAHKLDNALTNNGNNGNIENAQSSVNGDGGGANGGSNEGVNAGGTSGGNGLPGNNNSSEKAQEHGQQNA